MAKRSSTSTPRETPRRCSERNMKHADEDMAIKQEETTSNLRKSGKRPAASSTRDRTSKRVKSEELSSEEAPSAKRIKSTHVKLENPVEQKAKKTKTGVDKAAELQAKKLRAYAQFSNQSPFPDFPHPTAAECKLAHGILARLHGKRVRPEKVVAPANTAGCGDSSSVLDALVRTILSQNTSNKNSTRAKLSMDKVYGGSDKWDEIVRGGQTQLQKAIESGGLSVVKSKVIIGILKQVKEKYGVYSLDHLFEASNEDAMREMISFAGVGPKTASCVSLFCLQRESFAVDTHVHRITGLLGWRPKDATRDETHAHLDVRIPDEDKYGLHVLIVSHGRKCEECKAGGKSSGKCELRKAFRSAKIKDEADEDAKDENAAQLKEEESDVATNRYTMAQEAIPIT